MSGLCLYFKRSFLFLSRAFWIAFKMSVWLYPLLMRCCDNSVARISNVFGSEHMRLMRSAKLYGIFLEQCLGWLLFGSRYWWLSVGLVCRSTTILSFCMWDFVSRKICSLLDISEVNFMVGWNVFALWRKSWRESLHGPFHICVVYKAKPSVWF